MFLVAGGDEAVDLRREMVLEGGLRGRLLARGWVWIDGTGWQNGWWEGQVLRTSPFSFTFSSSWDSC
jgi:hypothetical protein